MGRRKGASSHANRGKAWEQLLELHHAALERDGQLVAVRTPPPFRQLAPMKGGQWRCVLVSDGPPDYMLLLPMPAGRPVAVAAEAKNLKEGRWGLDMLHDHQGLKLQAWHEHGGLAVVLLHHEPSRRGFVLPWAKLGPVWMRWRAGRLAGSPAPRGSASLGQGDLLTLGVPFGEGDRHSYLQALREAERQYDRARTAARAPVVRSRQVKGS